jgi:coatomer subunit beta
MSFLESAYALVHQDSAEQWTMQEFKTALEKGSDDVKVETMKKILGVMLNGDPYECSETRCMTKC